MDPSLSLLPVVWSQRSMNFLKIQVILDKSKPTRVAMIWRRVKVNRTRLCTAAHFARNEIKYQRSWESGLFQYKLYACTIACLSIIPFCKQQFYKCYPLSLHRNRRKAKNYHGQYLWQKGNLVKLIVNRQEILKADQDRTLWTVRLSIILTFHIALIYYTQDFRVYERTRDQPIPGPFPAPPIF